MRSTGVAFAFALALGASPVSSLVQTTPRAVDPLGKWHVSTSSDDGTPMTVDVEIGGKPGAYEGKAITNLGRVLPLTDLATTPSGMIAVFALPQGAIVVRWSADATGKFKGDWGTVQQAIPMTVERTK